MFCGQIHAPATLTYLRTYARHEQHFLAILQPSKPRLFVVYAKHLNHFLPTKCLALIVFRLSST